MTMQSPIHGRSCIDVRKTASKHATIIPKLLALHAICGCDTVAATYGMGKTKVITAARNGYTLNLLGQPTADIAKVMEHATAFMGACYSVSTPSSCMTEFRQ